MLEQSRKGGALYLTQVKLGSMASKRVNIADVRFATPTPITIYRVLDSSEFCVQINGRLGRYENNKLVSVLEGVQAAPETLSDDYYYGLAQYKGETHTYFIKQEPQVVATDLPDLSTFHLPSSLTGYPYRQSFTYPEGLCDILGKVAATFVDRYKRPLDLEAMRTGYYYPVAFDKVTTCFSDIYQKTTHFPIVCQLKGTNLAVLDLEPGYSFAEYKEIEKYQVIYSEDTPRGGKHFIIYSESPAFKYRVNEHLEVIVNTMVTFYGVNGRLIDHEVVSYDTFDYLEVGQKRIELPAEPRADIVHVVDLLVAANKRLHTPGEMNARQQLRLEDQSYGEYTAMKALYRYNIKPFEHELNKGDLPWIMAEYLSRIEGFRLKHNRQIRGVPYLVYAATRALQDF